MLKPGVHEVITSRFLVLQSKLLLLRSLQRHLSDTRDEKLNARIVAVELEIATAEDRYRAAMLEFGLPADADYWVVAYSHLIKAGNALVGRMREASVSLPPAERYEVSADVELIEVLVTGWTESLRTAMARAVA